MQSAFAPPPAKVGASASPFVDETYNLLGLNMSMPDQVMPSGETPFTVNARMYAREDGDSRVAIRTRRGSTLNTTALGETLDTQNVSAASVGDFAFSTTRIGAQKWVAGSSGALSRLDLEVRKASGATGYIFVEIRTDLSGFPGTLVGASSISPLTLTTSQQFLSAYFIDAPTITSGTTYWVSFYIQDNGSGNYYGNLSTGSTGLYSDDAGTSWTPAGGIFRFKTYVATAKGVKGYTRRYPSTGSKLTIMAVNDSIYSATDLGVVTSIDSALSTAPTVTRFENINDQTIWVNGVNNARTFNGTTVTDLAGAPVAPQNVIAHQNRLFFLTNNVLVQYSDLYNFTSYPAVNFFYVPNPKSSDPVAGWCKFQNNLIIFTHQTKHIIRGSDVSTFQRDEAVGTKGAASQEGIAVDHDYIYFVADDGMIYRWNGIRDELLSEKMQPEFNGITDPSKVRLHIYRNQLRVYYAKSPDTANNRMALYDIAYKQWFMDTGRPVTGSLALVQDNNALVEFSSLVGQVFNGETSNFSDVGKPIDFKYWTRYQTYAYRRRTGQTVGGASAKKRIRRFHPLVRTADADYTLSVGRDFDFANSPDMRAYVIAGGGAKWGSFVWGDGTKWGRKRIVDSVSSMSGRGKYVQYRFQRYGVETPVELYGYIAQLKIGRQK